MIRATYYYKKSNDPDGKIREHLLEFSKQLDFVLIDICLDDDPELADRLREDEASLQIGPYRLRAPFSDIDIQIAVRSYQERQNAKENLPGELKEKRPISITAADRFSFWFSKYYVWVITGIVAVFIGFPLLAPVLMETNHKTSAHAIYSVYSLFCHQLSYRSYFLYGEQPYYPRELAGIPNIKTYEEATGKSATDISFAQKFTGNSDLGYKVAICERDLAIYGSLILAGILFQVTGKKWKSIPWYFWMILAILPIGLDGGSQLFSLGGNWPGWLPIRESTPLLRTITGALFGLVTGWYVFPIMEENMREVRTNMALKLSIKKKLIERENNQ
jgi:uncharacterized membrane protein